MGNRWNIFRSVFSGDNKVVNAAQYEVVKQAAAHEDGMKVFEKTFPNGIESASGTDFFGNIEKAGGYVGGTSRPGNPLPYMSTDTGAKVPLYPIPLIRLFEISNHVPDVKTVLNVIQREMFKNDFDIQPKFNYKCKTCGKEFDAKPLEQLDALHMEDEEGGDEEGGGEEQDMGGDMEKAFPPGGGGGNAPPNAPAGGKDMPPGGGMPPEMQGMMQEPKPKEYKEPEMQCDICETKGEDNFAKPNPYEREVLQGLFDNSVNANNQNIEHLIRQYEYDLDVSDNAYCLILKDYYLKPISNDPDGAKLIVDEEKTEISEFLRIHPAQVAFIADSDGRIGYDDNRNRVYVCPDFRHRNQKITKPVCPDCGAKTLPALVEANTLLSAGITQPKKVVYAAGEIIWSSGKHTPDMMYGYSPLISVWKKAMALFHMDEYVLKYFDKQRPPRSLLVINSRNAESVKQFWEKQRQGSREDPMMPRPLLVENEKGGAKNAVELIDLVGKLQDIQFIEIREEFRQAIFAAYGLPPFVFGKVDKGGFGGANMQMTQVNRTTQANQLFLKKEFIDPLTRIMGIMDWEIIINKGEDTDKLRDEQLRAQKIDNASKLFNELGIPIWLDGNGDPQSAQVPDPRFIDKVLGGGMEMGGDQPGGKDGAKKKRKGSDSAKPNTEEDTKFEGEIHNKRPSDVGGSAQGDPNNAASLSNKAMDGKIQHTILKGIENGWTQTHMAKEVNKLFPNMSHDEAYTFVRDTLKSGLV